MKASHLIPSLAAFFMTGAVALAQYPGWKNSGSFFLNTTPDGANLPASTSVEEFAVLVRLHRDFFDFAAAKASGEDVRFSADAKPLAYQSEQWDAASGNASIWVQVPKIAGNAQQELKVHWGQADAASESRPPAYSPLRFGFPFHGETVGCPDAGGFLEFLRRRRTRLLASPYRGACSASTSALIAS